MVQERAVYAAEGLDVEAELVDWVLYRVPPLGSRVRRQNEEREKMVVLAVSVVIIVQNRSQFRLSFLCFYASSGCSFSVYHATDFVNSLVRLINRPRYCCHNFSLLLETVP